MKLKNFKKIDWPLSMLYFDNWFSLSQWLFSHIELWLCL